MKRAWIMTLAAAALAPAAFGQEAPMTTTAAPATTSTVAPTTASLASPVEPATGPVGSPTTAGAAGARTFDGTGERSGSRSFSRREEGSIRGSTAFPVAKLTDTQYAALENRSMFAKGRFDRSKIDNPGPPPDFKIDRPTPVAPVPPIERSLVFEGATMFDDEYVAFIEDFTAGKVLMLKSGDAVGTGKLGIISLNSIEFVGKASKVTVVPLGRNLEGGEAPSTRPSYVAGSDVPNTTTPLATSPTSPGGLTNAADAAAERMRLRRKAEMGN